MVRNRLSSKGLPLAVAVTTAAVVATGLASPVAAGAAPASSKLAPGIDTSTAVKGKADKSLGLPVGVPKKGSYSFLLKLDAKSTANVQKAAKSKGAAAAKSAAKSQLTRIKGEQGDVVADLPKGTSVIYRTHATLAGVAVRTDVKNFKALQGIDGVSAVYPIAPKKPTNATAVPLQGAPQAWVAYGDRGANSTIAIIDTGIDYTHADFGGPGTAASFETAQATEGSTADPSLFPNAKVIGGYDLAGDAYNADPASDPAGEYPYNPVPKPDDNPLDCNGHGSHVAGSAAGLGVNADGSTYTGAYNKKTPFDDLRIGPGMAPEAKLYAFRVFGCEGSTDLTAAAIERAMDPNNDGDTSDHVNVANLSLGSDFGSPEDGDTVVVQAASDAGVTMVISSGNNGDLYDTGGSPGNAVSALTVAASQDEGAVVDALNVTAPASIAGSYPAERSIAFDYKTGDLAGDVYQLTDPTNPDGCKPYNAADTAGAEGKIVFLEWTDDDTQRACGSVARGTNAENAKATGFLFADDQENFAAGITGSAKIPGVLVAKSGADAIRTQLEGGTTVTVGSTTANGQKQNDPALNDTLADFSSRGIRGAGNVKPDVTAVGATVFSAAVGTGNEGVNESGTSMAAPMTAGLAGLVTSLHQDWRPEQVKADIVNTAGQNLFVKPNHEGRRYAPNRVGTGRIEAKAALDNTVLAYVTDNPGAVSASFGPLEVTQATTTLTKTIKVENTGLTSATYAVSFQDRTTIPGVTYSVAGTNGTNQITVDPRSSGTVTLTLTIDRSKLTKTIDPTVDRQQGGNPREYVADASGLVLLKPTTGNKPTLRVAAYSAPRPASVMTQPASVTLPAGAVQTADLPLTGTRVNQGSGLTKVTSTVAGFELQATSPALPLCAAGETTGCLPFGDAKPGDLKYVGATSSAPQVASLGDNPLTSADGLAYFAISTHGPWRSPVGFQEYDVYADTTGDGVADVAIYNTRITGTDVFVASTVSLTTGATLANYPINDRLGDTDTALFDSDTLVLPVPLSVLPGVTAAKSRITYAVESYAGASGLVDTVGGVAGNGTITDGLSFDVLKPGVAVYGSYNGDASPLLYADSPGTLLKVRRDSAAYAADKGLGALIVHFHNAVGTKAQVVNLNAEASTTALSFSPNPAAVGQQVTATATVSGDAGPATGTVTLKSGGVTVGTGTLVDGKATFGFVPDAAGAYDYTAVYSGDSAYAGSTSPTATLTVVAAASTTTLTLDPTSTSVGQPVTASVAVTGAAGTADGSVTLKQGDTTVATKDLVDGKADFTVTPTTSGSIEYTAVYFGNGTYGESTSAPVTLTVDKIASTTTLSVAPSTVSQGQNSVSTITVTGAAATPTGTVTLKAGSAVLGTATLVDGKATIDYKRTTVGTLSLTATYAGDGVYTTSTSDAVTLTIVKAKAVAKVKLAISPTTVVVNKPVTVTGSVGNTVGVPTGTYSLRIIRSDGTAGNVASGTLVNGAVKFAYTPKAAGTYQYALYYSGDANYLSGKSVNVTLKVTA